MSNNEQVMQFLKIDNLEEFEQIGKIAKELGLCRNNTQCSTCLPQLNCPYCETFELARAVYKAGFRKETTTRMRYYVRRINKLSYEIRLYDPNRHKNKPDEYYSNCRDEEEAIARCKELNSALYPPQYILLPGEKCGMEVEE